MIFPQLVHFSTHRTIFFVSSRLETQDDLLVFFLPEWEKIMMNMRLSWLSFFAFELWSFIAFFLVNVWSFWTFQGRVRLLITTFFDDLRWCFGLKCMNTIGSRRTRCHFVFSFGQRLLRSCGGWRLGFVFMLSQYSFWLLHRSFNNKVNYSDRQALTCQIFETFGCRIAVEKRIIKLLLRRVLTSLSIYIMHCYLRQLVRKISFIKDFSVYHNWM